MRAVETLDAVQLAQFSGYTAVLSHRSGETEDSTIADLAVATRSAARSRPARSAAPTRMKFPASSRRRLRLLRIEQQLGKNAVYAGRNALPKARR